MTKVPAKDCFEEFQELLDGYAAMLKTWRDVASRADAASVEATLNNVKTAMWNLRNTYDMFVRLDDQMAAVQRRVERATERADAKREALKKKARG
jgi:hypothetical protein